MNDYDYKPQQLVTTLADLEAVFKLMQEHAISEVTIGDLIVRTRLKFPDLTIDKKAVVYTDEDILRNPHVGLEQ